MRMITAGMQPWELTNRVPMRQKKGWGGLSVHHPPQTEVLVSGGLPLLSWLNATDVCDDR